MSEERAPFYAWRMAAKFDIGSIARFGDTNGPKEPWTYDILIAVESDPTSPSGFRYIGEKRTVAPYCEVQYDRNALP